MNLNSLIYKVCFSIFMIVGVISCDNPNNIDPPPADIGFVPDDIIEVIIDEAVSVLAGDIESPVQYPRGSQTAERNN